MTFHVLLVTVFVSAVSNGAFRSQLRHAENRLVKQPLDVVDDTPAAVPPQAGVLQESRYEIAKMFKSGLTYWGYPKDTKGHHSWSPHSLSGAWGAKCETSNVCGTQLVCREGACTHCEKSAECADKYTCMPDPISGEHLCVERDLISQWEHGETICTFLVIITAILSSAAGMGGGGVYVPLLLLFLGLSTHEAVPLSQAMCLGGAVVNVMMFLGERSPVNPDKPKIDFDLVMMLNPALSLGVVFGVLAHLVCPPWLTLAVLLVTLVLAFQKSITRGVKLFKAESAAAAEVSSGGSRPDAPSSGGAGGMGSKQKKRGSVLQGLAQNTKQLMLILGCWVSYLCIHTYHVQQCSGAHMVQLGCFVTMALALTAMGSRCVSEDSSLDMSRPFFFPLMAGVAGFLGGFLGIGGGMVMGPLLLELGLHPEVSQATTAMFVFLSASLGTTQFLVHDKEMPFFALWFTVWVICATLVGQTGVEYIIRMYKRTSIIVLCVAALVGASMVMMFLASFHDVKEQFQTGEGLGLNFHHLCGGGR